MSSWRWVPVLTARSEGGGSNAEQAARKLVETQQELSKTQEAITEIQKFLQQIRANWLKPKDRIIGYVVWAPSISVSTAPHNYTKDVCIIKLDEKRFLPNFRGNVLNLGAYLSV